MKIVQIGQQIYVDSWENFGGKAVVIDEREASPDAGDPQIRYKVRMENGSEFWAFDAEIAELREEKRMYDSRVDTYAHIQTVQSLLAMMILELSRRQLAHDQSKLDTPEKEAFDEFTPKLATSTYGSEEYKGFLAAMKPALDHHYAANSHHPEHYPDGIRGMNLLDVVEMLADWKAATMRHNDGDIRKSIEINQKRFGYSDELKQIFLNTLPLIEGRP